LSIVFEHLFFFVLGICGVALFVICAGTLKDVAEFNLGNLIEDEER